MKKIFWFTSSNFDSLRIEKQYLAHDSLISFDLTKYVEFFKNNEIWNKNKYRTEYCHNYDLKDLNKIKSFKINFHRDGEPFSNFHNYEKVLNQYINLEKIEPIKIASSSISEAKKIVVIVVEFESRNKLIKNLSYKEEKDIDEVIEKLSKENYDSWIELEALKSIIYEFLQFFLFNLHLNFLTKDYSFSFVEKPNLIGFSTVTENENIYFEVDKIDIFNHYILYEKDKDILENLMYLTSKIWFKNINPIHFFLDALKGNYINYNNFIKLVFTLESFFQKNTSRDFMILSICIILNHKKNNHYRDILNKSFQLRNEIVHGGNIFGIYDIEKVNGKEKKIYELFFDLKNLIVEIFHFFLDTNYSKYNFKINHELIIEHLKIRTKI